MIKFRVMLWMNKPFVQAEYFDNEAGFGFRFQTVNSDATNNGLATNEQPVILGQLLNDQ